MHRVALTLGTGFTSPRFPRMRIPEENCNMLLLGAVTAFSVAAAGVVYVLEPGPAPQPQAVQAVHVAEQTPIAPVRVIGTPFVPNTNPRER